MNLLRRNRENEPQQLQLEGMTEQPELTKLRRIRRGLVIGGLALFSIAIGIDVANGSPETRSQGQESEVASDSFEDALPVLIPASAAAMLLISALPTTGLIMEEKRRIRELEQGTQTPDAPA